jgi:hypothetical protein
MIFGQIDRGREYNGAPAARLGETGQKFVPRHYRGAVLNRAQKFSEILSLERAPMFLFAKHDRVIKVKDDSRIGPAQCGQLEIGETKRFEKHHQVVPRGLSQHTHAPAQVRPTRRKNRRLNTHLGIVRETIAQTQARAGRVSVFDYAKSSHECGIIAACCHRLKRISRKAQLLPIAEMLFRLIAVTPATDWRRSTSLGAASSPTAVKETFPG